MKNTQKKKKSRSYHLLDKVSDIRPPIFRPFFSFFSSQARRLDGRSSFLLYPLWKCPLEDIVFVDDIQLKTHNMLLHDLSWMTKQVFNISIQISTRLTRSTEKDFSKQISTLKRFRKIRNQVAAHAQNGAKCPLRQLKILSEMVWYFTGVYAINRISHTRLWIWIVPSRVQLDISLVCCASSRDIELNARR